IPRKRRLPFLGSDLLSARALLRRAARRQYIIETEVKLTDRNTAAAFKLIRTRLAAARAHGSGEKKGQIPRKRRRPFLGSDLSSRRALFRWATRRHYIIETEIKLTDLNTAAAFKTDLEPGSPRPGRTSPAHKKARYRGNGACPFLFLNSYQRVHSCVGPP